MKHQEYLLATYDPDDNFLVDFKLSEYTRNKYITGGQVHI